MKLFSIISVIMHQPFDWNVVNTCEEGVCFLEQRPPNFVILPTPTPFDLERPSGMATHVRNERVSRR